MWEQLSLFFNNPYEVHGFVFTLICVWLNTQEDIWAWFFAIIAGIEYAIVFLGAKIYAEFGLQLFFIITSFYGWYQWRFGKIKKVEKSLYIRYNSTQSYLLFLLFALLSFTTLYLILIKFSDTDVPFLDAITTAISLTAQTMLAKKFIENWLLWIVANSIYIILFIYKGLYLTAILYAILWVMAVYGWLKWQKLYKTAS